MNILSLLLFRWTRQEGEWKVCFHKLFSSVSKIVWAGAEAKHSYAAYKDIESFDFIIFGNVSL